MHVDAVATPPGVNLNGASEFYCAAVLCKYYFALLLLVTSLICHSTMSDSPDQ
jgi:hypothetical protein